MDVAPALGMHALLIVAHIEESSPILLAQCGGVLGPRDMRVSAIAEFQFRALAAIGAGNEKHRSRLLMRHRRRGGFVDEAAGAEAFEAEGRVDRMRLVPRDGMREDMSGTRRRLETA